MDSAEVSFTLQYFPVDRECAVRVANVVRYQCAHRVTVAEEELSTLAALLADDALAEELLKAGGEAQLVGPPLDDLDGDRIPLALRTAGDPDVEVVIPRRLLRQGTLEAPNDLLLLLQKWARRLRNLFSRGEE